MIETLIGFALIFLLALMRFPLAFAMGLVGLGGIAYTRSLDAALASTAQVVYETGFAYTLSVIPLFILMGNFVARAGLAHELFAAAHAFIGHKRGGIAHATFEPAPRCPRFLNCAHTHAPLFKTKPCNHRGCDTCHATKSGSAKPTPQCNHCVTNRSAPSGA